MKVMAGSHGIISNKLNKNHSKSPRKWNSAFTSSISNCTKTGAMVTGVWMNYQPKTMRPPPPHTHTFCRDLYHESHPECCYGLIVSIRMESTQSICGQPQTVMLPDSLALRPLERKEKAHWNTHKMGSIFPDFFSWFQMWLFLSFPDFGIVHTTGHYLRRCLVLLATSTNPHVAWLGVHLQD